MMIFHSIFSISGGGSFTLKLAFSPSSSISPTAPTVAPAVAAAAVAATGISTNPLGPIGSPMHMHNPGGSPNGVLSNGVMDHMNSEMEHHLSSPENQGQSP